MENELVIKTVEGMTDEMFFDLCQANSELRMERDQHGNIIVMSPTGGFTGNFNFEIYIGLGIWNRQSKLGYGFDSSTGYVLPNGATRSPDASWVTKDRYEASSVAERKKFLKLYPDFAVEIRSETDRMNNVKSKMEEYRTNGCRLGWLINPQGKAVHIYRQDGSIEIRKGNSIELSGENVLSGFVMELNF